MNPLDHCPSHYLIMLVTEFSDMSTSFESNSDIDDCTMSVSDTRNTTNSLSRFTSEILTLRHIYCLLRSVTTGWIYIDTWDPDNTNFC